MEISPWLRVSYNNSSVVNVDHELAAVPPSRSNSLGCESELLHYDVFHYYMPERDFSEDTFFDAIRTLRTVKGAQQSGREVVYFFFLNNFSFYLNYLFKKKHHIDSFVWFYSNYTFTFWPLPRCWSSVC